MKKNSLSATLALLVLSTTAAFAAPSDSSEPSYTLPSFEVSSPRYTPSEKAINSSLAQFVRDASVSLPPATELPTLGTTACQAKPDHGRTVAKTPTSHAARRS